MEAQVERRRSKGGKILLIILVCVLIAALGVAGYFLYTILQDNDRIMKNASVLGGISVAGIDISNMTGDEAYKATAKASDDLLTKTVFTIDVEGEKLTYTAKDLGMTTDYDDVMKKAIAFGHSDSLEERKQAIIDAESGVNYSLKVVGVKENAEKVLLPQKASLDKQPTDATFEFAPWGYLADGTIYQPDKQAIIEAASKNQEVQYSADLVRLTADQMPNKYRYEYWENSKYTPDYIPADANIARFKYTEGVNGRSVDMEAVVESVMSEVQSGKYDVIKAPVSPVEPTVKAADLQKKNQLISSWTSSYSKHLSLGRNWNVAKLSGIICGVTIQPGEEWSINKLAGTRTVASGWKKAPGIENGGYTDQPGGGVCQISSTTYNAALRAALTITEAKHHSIRSNYIPLGLDATISSGSPDLKFKNPYDTPVYIVSYINPKEKNVTVEIYGPPVTDPQYGEVIYSYTSKSLGYYGTPSTKTIYNTSTAPDGHALRDGESYRYAEARKGQRAQIYRLTLSLTGETLKTEDFGKYDCDPINGIVYVNGPNPADVPEPDPDTQTGFLSGWLQGLLP